MNPRPHSPGKHPLMRPSARRQGSALLIILAFVLLLTLVTTAFLSKALLERNVSNASADQTRTDLFAQGAVDAVVSDFQQEIAAGSTITPVPAGTGTVYIYAPITTSTFNGQTMVPSRTWIATGTTATLPNDPLPNLLKRSACALTFYPAVSTMTGTALYPNVGTYPPIEKTFTLADANDSTAIPSLNGRAYTAARWNQSLLLPKKTPSSNTDLTPTGPSGTFTVPDWILVRRDGTNPTVFSNTGTTSVCLTAPNDATTTNSNPVVGRYAYLVYDEGGVLDANVVGFAQTGTTVATTGTFLLANYKSSLANVDLMQLLTSGTGAPYFTQAQINALVGWRNYATLQATGSITTPYGVTLANATNYFLNALSLTTGYMQTGTYLNGGQTDRKFSSRQQLIDVLLNSIATGTAQQATLQNALQYLGTFSRDLSQPSYYPDLNRPRMKTGTITVTTTTGTSTTTTVDAAQFGANVASVDDLANKINVSFPGTLVTGTFVRNDGSIAQIGDPVVKKRFALNRLAWLTYLGPIADDAGNINSNTTITAIYNAYVAAGISPKLLKQGGPTNIKNYFGLQWQLDTDNRYKWFYNVHPNSVSAGKGIIREMGGASGIDATGDTSPHDPDFFELLKASILAGSKGKTLFLKSGTFTASLGEAPYPTDSTHPYNEQYNYDISLDFSILQIGANIMDQFDADAYPTEIVYDNGVNPALSIYGVENFPYLYRLRMGSLKLRNEGVVVPDTVHKETTAETGSVTTMSSFTNFKDTGVAALMQIPEIWNPHDVNSPLGNPYPRNFRLVVDSADPALVAADLPTGTFTNYSAITAYGTDTIANSPLNQGANDSDNVLTTATNTPFFSYSPNDPTGAGGTIGGVAGNNGFQTSNVLTPANTALTFSATGTSTGTATPATITLYREPTMLVRPGLPANSGLAMGWTPPANSDLAKVRNAAGALAFTGSGLISDSSNPLNLSVAPTGTQAYLGIVLGLYPVQWSLSASSDPTQQYIYVASLGRITGAPSAYLTYRMQYEYPTSSGTWVTYDVKYIAPQQNWIATATGTASVGNLVTPNSFALGRFQSAAWQSFADPRSSRFGTPLGVNDAVYWYSAPAISSASMSAASAWLDSANDILVSDRPDYNQGYILQSYRTGTVTGGNSSNLSSFVNYLAPGWAGAGNSTYTGFRWGPLSQNTTGTVTANGIRYVGDAISSGSITLASLSLKNKSYYYADPDGVVRRAMAGNVPNANANTFGIPQITATTFSGSPAPYTTPGTGQSMSRPYLLNRPFRSVAELGCVFSGTPWKNLDFTNPESGDAPLLDTFSVNDTDDPNGLVAGKVNLNTHQIPVLTALLYGAYYDDFNPVATGTANAQAGFYIGSREPYENPNGAVLPVYSGAAYSLANLLATGTKSLSGSGTYTGTSGLVPRPLVTVRDLVGKWINSTQPANLPTVTDGTASSNYIGFSSDLNLFYDPNGAYAQSYYDAWNQRCHEAAVRALSAVGTTRVWNLMIDVVAQTGKYPATAKTSADFLVEGERRYWVHVAIDRYTGKILDRQIEEVKQ